MYFKNYHPTFMIHVTLPDGTEYKQETSFSRKEASWSSKRCDVRYGKHYFTGDLKDYEIHVEPVNGLGADLKLHSLSAPFRPGSAYIEFGAENRNYTWLCAVPTGEVTGTLTIGGKEQRVHGYGYHDHQWGNVNFLKEWNHWVWARQNFEECSMTVFDMVSNEKTEYTRFPFVFIQDREGNLLFENTQNVQCDVLDEYEDVASEKIYPKVIHYIFENGGKRADYTLRMKDIIECNGKNNLPAQKRFVTKAAGIDPAYTRYTATGTLILSCTLDLLTPFFAALLFAQITMLLAKRAGLWRCRAAGFGLCICACLSDWAENICMITVLVSYPARIMAAAAAARIFTALKYAVMIALIALIIYMFIKVKKRIND